MLRWPRIYSIAEIAEPLRLAACADAVSFGFAEFPAGVDGLTVGITPHAA